LKSLEIKGNYKFSAPTQIELYDSLLMVVDYGLDSNLVSIVSINSGKYINSFCKRGNDENSFFPPLYIQSDKRSAAINVFSKRDKTFGSYRVEDIIRNNNELFKKKVTLNEKVGSAIAIDSQIVADGFFPDKRVGLIGINGIDIKTYIKYPEKPQNVKPENKFLAYQSLITSNSNRIVLASVFSDNILFAKKQGDTLYRITEKQERYPIFIKSSRAGKPIYKPSPLNKLGFISIASTKNYVFGLYANETVNRFMRNLMGCDIVLVYDWNGKPKFGIRLDRMMRFITISPEKKQLIGLSAERDPKLYSFSLKDLCPDL